MNVAVWRCRNHAERLRLLDMTTRLRPAKRWSMGLLVIAALVALPDYGWPMEVPLAVAAGLLAASQQLVDRVRRPEDVLAAVWLFALIAIVTAIGLANGPRVYTLYILLVPTLLAAPVFPPRVAAFGAAMTIAAMIVAAFAYMPGAVVSAPPVLIDPAAITIVIAMLAVRTLEVERASRNAAVLDPLTGLLNRSALQSRAMELHRVGEGEHIAVVVGDIDRFKSINDDHGHAAGDAVLVEVARRLERVAAAKGAVYRFGGEEFVVLVEGGCAGAAVGLAEEMRDAVAATPIAGLAITLSLGVSISTEDVRGFAPLFSAADRALYRAKAAGRNCVRTFPPEEGEEETVAAALDRRAAMLEPSPDHAPQAAAGAPRRRAAAAAPTARAAGGRGADALAREERGSLILPTVADRQHMVAIVNRTAEISKTIEPVVGVALAASVPWFGWHLLIPVALATGVLQVILFRVAPRSARPEYPILAGLVLVTIGTGVSIVLSKPEALFALPFFVILMFSNSAGLPTRSAAALALVTGAVMCATALLVDASAVEQLPSIVVFPLTLLGSVTIFGFAIGRMTFDQRELSTTDHLTGALTRAALHDHVGHLTRRDAERQESIAMLIADLDHFKAINDEHGHGEGDAVLAAAAERIRSTLRPLDALYRVGGEEFLVILEGVDETAAGNIAERVRAAFHRQPISGMSVTVSLGVAALAPGQPFDYDGLFASADAALLAAKAAGRDGVMRHAALAQPLAA